MNDDVERLNELLTKALAASEGGTSPTFDEAFDRFIEFLRALQMAYYKKNFAAGLASGLFKPEIETEPGKKYVRIIYSSDPSSRSAWGFIDTTNGNILKADSWKRPAPQPRGNVYQPKSWKTVGPHGPASLR
jgi:hypothetical protein